MKQFHTCFAKQLLTQFVGISFTDVHGTDLGIDDQFRADAAWLMRAIEYGAFGAGAIDPCLDDGILFGMDTSAKFVHGPGRDTLLLSHASRISAMADTFGATIVTGGQYLVIFHQYCSYLSSKTGAASGCQKGHLHEITLPSGSRVHIVLLVRCISAPFLGWVKYVKPVSRFQDTIIRTLSYLCVCGVGGRKCLTEYHAILVYHSIGKITLKECDHAQNDG
jgi:hypothetical protein